VGRRTRQQQSHQQQQPDLDDCANHRSIPI
jgi:hypothetical protein